ncbi:GNAT family N-acetyltransferase [Saccharospirillum salsuginis]|uniref:GNAT family acetyltransferase n=1 Tax=Saccharospirillum salsuginis TaxID=418750 RepID=A0A918KBY8_9GAMM|nr:GNAT family N-acetyltransferase [Saccharospirillum salsuginis]GGX57878.1 GNAT family acetyltransferase [Saccharospirillum salsuginis]
MANTSLRTVVVKGPGLEPWLQAVSELRIRVFRDFPYLYDGSLDYERNYLQTYVDSDTALCVLALDGDRVVGASTGLAMADETDEFRRPLDEAGLHVDSVFYCAESVLLPEYRGHGLYRAFFEAREAHARALGKTVSVFCAVKRPDDHPLKPRDYQPLDPVWRRFGYRPEARIQATFPWKDIDQPVETDKPLMFYRKVLEENA